KATLQAYITAVSDNSGPSQNEITLSRHHFFHMAKSIQFLKPTIARIETISNLCIWGRYGSYVFSLPSLFFVSMFVAHLRKSGPGTEESTNNAKEVDYTIGQLLVTYLMAMFFFCPSHSHVVDASITERLNGIIHKLEANQFPLLSPLCAEAADVSCMKINIQDLRTLHGLVDSVHYLRLNMITGFTGKDSNGDPFYINSDPFYDVPTTSRVNAYCEGSTKECTSNVEGIRFTIVADPVVVQRIDSAVFPFTYVEEHES